METFDEIKEWNRLVDEAMSIDGETNFKYPFNVLTKKYGRAYIEYLKAAWEAWGESGTKQDFCRLNHCSEEFLNKICN